MKAERTEIQELGEFGLIDRLTRNNEITQMSTLLSTGDDTAVVDHLGKPVLITTDMLLEGIHFDLAYVPLKHLGYKSVVVNLSDICAMGGIPTQITVSIGISNRFSVEALDEFYEGIYAACSRYQVDLVGGDTCSSMRGFVISVTAIGTPAVDKYITRSGAKVNDLICVTGYLGSAYLGLQLLEREKKIFLENPNIQPDLQQKAHIVGKFLKPEARTDIIDWLTSESLFPSAMIDVSDGLSSELKHLCKQSHTGCHIYEDKLPIHEEARGMAMEFGVDPTTCALNGGEDYELLFTIPPQHYEQIKNHPDISVIGYMTELEKGMYLETRQGNKHELVAQGWKAF